MNIEDSKAKIIYRREYDGKVFYSMGINHKKQDGSYENGYINVRFPKNADIKDKTKIMIIQGWLDFYIKDKITNHYIFINKYEIVQEYPTNQTGKETIQNDIPTNAKTIYEDSNTDIHLTDDDLPF